MDRGVVDFGLDKTRESSDRRVHSRLAFLDVETGLKIFGRNRDNNWFAVGKDDGKAVNTGGNSDVSAGRNNADITENLIGILLADHVDGVLTGILGDITNVPIVDRKVEPVAEDVAESNSAELLVFFFSVKLHGLLDELSHLFNRPVNRIDASVTVMMLHDALNDLLHAHP